MPVPVWHYPSSPMVFKVRVIRTVLVHADRLYFDIMRMKSCILHTWTWSICCLRSLSPSCHSFVGLCLDYLALLNKICHRRGKVCLQIPHGIVRHFHPQHLCHMLRLSPVFSIANILLAKNHVIKNLSFYWLSTRPHFVSSLVPLCVPRSNMA